MVFSLMIRFGGELCCDDAGIDRLQGNLSGKNTLLSLTVVLIRKLSFYCPEKEHSDIK
jgi:hypothetical protein